MPNPDQHPLSAEEPLPYLDEHQRDAYRDSFTIFVHTVMAELKERLGTCPPNCLMIGDNWDFLMIVEGGNMVYRSPIVKTPLDKDLLSTLVGVESMLKTETEKIGKRLYHLGSEGFVIIDRTSPSHPLDKTGLSEIETTEYGSAGLLSHIPIHIYRQGF